MREEQKIKQKIHKISQKYKRTRKNKTNLKLKFTKLFNKRNRKKLQKIKSRIIHKMSESKNKKYVTKNKTVKK